MAVRSIGLDADGGIVVMLEGGKSVPVGNVAVTDEQWAQINEIKREIWAEGRGDLVRWVDGKPVKPLDERPIYRVSMDKAVVPKGNDLTVTVTAVDDKGNVRANFQGEHTLMIEGDEYVFVFVKGVATRKIDFDQTFDWSIKDSQTYRVEVPKTATITR